jgi:hypothetical protein
MNLLSSDLVDEITQNCEIVDIINLSHTNNFLNKEIKKIFENKNTKTNKEYSGLNILDPLEFIYINRKDLHLKKIKEYYNVYDKLLNEQKIDLFALYRLYNNFLKLFKDIHILTNNEGIIKNYYLLVKTMIIINMRCSYIFEEKAKETGDYTRMKNIIMSLLRIILLVNPLKNYKKYQYDMKRMFYDFLEKIIKNLSKKKITEEIFFIRFLKDYLYELDNDCLIISYIEIYEIKKFIKRTIKENNFDIYNISP